MTEGAKVEVLERGDICFAYRPRVGVETPKGIDDVQRLYMILSPREEGRYRLIVIGRKRMPALEDGGERYWAFVERVSRKPEAITGELGGERYETKTRGTRTQPAARPVGEGVYAIARHGDHTHLAYVLELPGEQREVQRALNIVPEGSYILSVKNPEVASPPGVGLEHEEAEFPKHLQARFRGRRFIDVDPPTFLNHAGAELLLVGAGGDASDALGITLNAERETEDSAEILNDLKLDRQQHPTAPLLTGEWA